MTNALARHVLDLADHVTTTVGIAPLNDQIVADLRDGSAVVGAVDSVAAIASVRPDGVTMQVLVPAESATSRSAETLTASLRGAATDVLGQIGGAAVTWWVFDAAMTRQAATATTTVAAELGFSPARSVLQLRRDLPAPDRSSVVTRSFTPADAEAWLAVNNRAFRDHPEQGGWTRETLEQRQRQPWFDPDGFRLYERDEQLAAFCWTKAHAYESPPSGEIYVIGVDPAFQGRGLGRELTLAGLDAMVAAGLTVAQLYVDADNTPARRLYESLGFEVARRDDSYRRVG